MENLYITLFSLIFILTLTTIIHLIGGIICCWLYKIKINKIQLFYGKPLFEFKFKNYIIEIGWIMTGGSIDYDYEGVVKNRSKLTRIILNLSGPVAVVISAMLILGPLESFREVSTGFRQFFNGAISPFEVGEVYVSMFFMNVLPNSISLAYAILACKIAAVNLLPLPPLNGGNIIVELLINPNKIKQRIVFQNIGLLLILPIIVLWGIAIVSFLIKQF